VTIGAVGQKFTGKERDAETGLDFFGARYMSSAQGRFTSPDGPFNDQDPSDPQSWNLYAYTRNNPLIFVDPNGRECVTLDSCGFRRRRTLIPEGTRTAFRTEGEQSSERSDASISIVQEVFGFVKRNCPKYPKRSEGSGHTRGWGCGARGGSLLPRSALEQPQSAWPCTSRSVFDT